MPLPSSASALRGRQSHLYLHLCCDLPQAGRGDTHALSSPQLAPSSPHPLARLPRLVAANPSTLRYDLAWPTYADKLAFLREHLLRVRETPAAG